MNLAEFRRQMPVTEQFVYFDNAGVSPLPTPVMDAVDASLRSRNLHGKAGLVATYLEAFDRCRKAGARLIGAGPEDMALVRNTTEGLNIIAQGYPWRPDDNVVTVDVEYPSNVYPWLNLKSRGVGVRMVKSRSGLVSIDDIEAAMDGQTRILALSHVEFISGQVLDLVRLGQICRKRGVRFVVDAAQSLGALTIDVHAMGIDALASCGWKWLLGPLGTGLLFCSPAFLGELALTFAGPQSMKPCELLSYEFALRDDAARFEYSTHDHAGFQGLATALDLIESIGMSSIETALRKHAARLREGLSELGYEVLGGADGPRSGIVSFRFPQDTGRCNADELAGYFCSRAIYCGERCGYVRFSPHFYNTKSEIEQAIDVAAAAWKRFRPEEA